MWFWFQLGYWPIWVSVLILDLNQNSGFGRTLGHTNLEGPDEDNKTSRQEQEASTSLG